MKAILNEIMFQNKLSKIFRMIYEKLTISSLIIYLFLIYIIPIIFLASRKLNKSKNKLDSEKNIQERHFSKKKVQEPSKDKKENESNSTIFGKMIDFCISKKKRQKVPSQLQFGILLREEEGAHNRRK